MKVGRCCVFVALLLTAAAAFAQQTSRQIVLRNETITDLFVERVDGRSVGIGPGEFLSVSVATEQELHFGQIANRYNLMPLMALADADIVLLARTNGCLYLAKADGAKPEPSEALQPLGFPICPMHTEDLT
ncbi:MAG TPA: hypothetical protein VFV64_03405 [Permianibacter sp.]|nr:hypothetical protein [Permianibacter sp.]